MNSGEREEGEYIFRRCDTKLVAVLGGKSVGWNISTIRL